MTVNQGIPRAAEAIVALLLLVFLLPVLALAALAVVLSSPGRALFKQVRVGRGGRSFVLLKLRTMRADDARLQITAADDSRITPVGGLLRRWKLDELPQLWNVVRGDMALVGPRPEVARYVDLQSAAWQQVLQVRPGLTDPVTLQLRAEESLLAAIEGDRERFYLQKLQPHKLQGYIQYLNKRTWQTDVNIIWQTMAALIRTEKASLPSVEEFSNAP
jgi:lipopolysaccharide/colanic/teichoic acid biosynthesis glycosyltransferase